MDSRIKIATILPSLANEGPEIVALDIIEALKDQGTIDSGSTVYYFDEVDNALSFPIPTKRISLWQKIDFSKYDLVHSHGFRPDAYLYLHKSTGTPSVSTMHNMMYKEFVNDYPRWMSTLAEKLWIHFLKAQVKVVTLTEEMRTYYSRRMPEAKLTVINNGRTLRPAHQISDEDHDTLTEFTSHFKTVWGTACRVIKRKGLDQIIRILPDFPDSGLIIVGDGPEMESLKLLSTDLGVRQQCLFLGYRSNATDFYPYFDIFVLPSHAEGLPLSLIEATARECACVCSDIEVHREIFTPEEVSFFHLGDLESLKDCMTFAQDHQEELSKNSHKKYLERYTAEAMARNYLTTYLSITN